MPFQAGHVRQDTHERMDVLTMFKSLALNEPLWMNEAIDKILNVLREQQMTR